MTDEETRKILTILKTTYPQSFKDWNKEQASMFLDLWSEAFKFDDVEIVVKAVKHIIYTDTREFAPNIAQVKNAMFGLYIDTQTDVNDAWSLVLKGAKCDISSARSYYNKLPENVQKAISPAFLQELGYSTSEQVGYKRLEFEKKYKSVLEHDKNLYLCGEISIEQLQTINSQPRLESHESKMLSIADILGINHEG